MIISKEYLTLAFYLGVVNLINFTIIVPISRINSHCTNFTRNRLLESDASLLTQLIRACLAELDPTQVQAILETLVHMDHRFDRHWPPQQARMRSARSWDGQLNATGNVYTEFMRATKGTRRKCNHAFIAIPAISQFNVSCVNVVLIRQSVMILKSLSFHISQGYIVINVVFRTVTIERFKIHVAPFIGNFQN